MEEGTTDQPSLGGESSFIVAILNYKETSAKRSIPSKTHRNGIYFFAVLAVVVLKISLDLLNLVELSVTIDNVSIAIGRSDTDLETEMKLSTTYSSHSWLDVKLSDALCKVDYFSSHDMKSAQGKYLLSFMLPESHLSQLSSEKLTFHSSDIDYVTLRTSAWHELSLYLGSEGRSSAMTKCNMKMSIETLGVSFYTASKTFSKTVEITNNAKEFSSNTNNARLRSQDVSSTIQLHVAQTSIIATTDSETLNIDIPAFTWDTQSQIRPQIRSSIQTFEGKSISATTAVSKLLIAAIQGKQNKLSVTTKGPAFIEKFIGTSHHGRMRKTSSTNQSLNVASSEDNMTIDPSNCVSFESNTTEVIRMCLVNHHSSMLNTLTIFGFDGDYDDNNNNALLNLVSWTSWSQDSDWFALQNFKLDTLGGHSFETNIKFASEIHGVEISGSRSHNSKKVSQFSVRGDITDLRLAGKIEDLILDDTFVISGHANLPKHMNDISVLEEWVRDLNFDVKLVVHNEHDSSDEIANVEFAADLNWESDNFALVLVSDMLFGSSRVLQMDSSVVWFDNQLSARVNEQVNDLAIILDGSTHIVDDFAHGWRSDVTNATNPEHTVSCSFKVLTDERAHTVSFLADGEVKFISSTQNNDMIFAKGFHDGDSCNVVPVFTYEEWYDYFSHNPFEILPDGTTVLIHAKNRFLATSYGLFNEASSNTSFVTIATVQNYAFVEQCYGDHSDCTYTALVPISVSEIKRNERTVVGMKSEVVYLCAGEALYVDNSPTNDRDLCSDSQASLFDSNLNLIRSEQISTGTCTKSSRTKFLIEAKENMRGCDSYYLLYSCFESRCRKPNAFIQASSANSGLTIETFIITLRGGTEYELRGEALWSPFQLDRFQFFVSPKSNSTSPFYTFLTYEALQTRVDQASLSFTSKMSFEDEDNFLFDISGKAVINNDKYNISLVDKVSNLRLIEAGNYSIRLHQTRENNIAIAREVDLSQDEVLCHVDINKYDNYVNITTNGKTLLVDITNVDYSDFYTFRFVSMNNICVMIPVQLHYPEDIALSMYLEAQEGEHVLVITHFPSVLSYFGAVNSSDDISSFIAMSRKTSHGFDPVCVTSNCNAEFSTTKSNNTSSSFKVYTCGAIVGSSTSNCLIDAVYPEYDTHVSIADATGDSMIKYYADIWIDDTFGLIPAIQTYKKELTYQCYPGRSCSGFPIAIAFSRNSAIFGRFSEGKFTDLLINNNHYLAIGDIHSSSGNLMVHYGTEANSTINVQYVGVEGSVQEAILAAQLTGNGTNNSLTTSLHIRHENKTIFDMIGVANTNASTLTFQLSDSISKLRLIGDNKMSLESVYLWDINKIDISVKRREEELLGIRGRAMFEMKGKIAISFDLSTTHDTKCLWHSASDVHLSNKLLHVSTLLQLAESTVIEELVHVASDSRNFEVDITSKLLDFETSANGSHGNEVSSSIRISDASRGLQYYPRLPSLDNTRKCYVSTLGCYRTNTNQCKITLQWDGLSYTYNVNEGYREMDVLVFKVIASDYGCHLQQILEVNRYDWSGDHNNDKAINLALAKVKEGDVLVVSGAGAASSLYRRIVLPKYPQLFGVNIGNSSPSKDPFSSISIYHKNGIPTILCMHSSMETCQQQVDIPMITFDSSKVFVPANWMTREITYAYNVLPNMRVCFSRDPFYYSTVSESADPIFRDLPGIFDVKVTSMYDTLLTSLPLEVFPNWWNSMVLYCFTNPFEFGYSHFDISMKSAHNGNLYVVSYGYPYIHHRGSHFALTVPPKYFIDISSLQISPHKRKSDPTRWSGELSWDLNSSHIISHLDMRYTTDTMTRSLLDSTLSLITTEKGHDGTQYSVFLNDATYGCAMEVTGNVVSNSSLGWRLTVDHGSITIDDKQSCMLHGRVGYTGIERPQVWKLYADANCHDMADGSDALTMSANVESKKLPGSQHLYWANASWTMQNGADVMFASQGIVTADTKEFVIWATNKINNDPTFFMRAGSSYASMASLFRHYFMELSWHNTMIFKHHSDRKPLLTIDDSVIHWVERKNLLSCSTTKNLRTDLTALGFSTSPSGQLLLHFKGNAFSSNLQSFKLKIKLSSHSSEYRSLERIIGLKTTDTSLAQIQNNGTFMYSHLMLGFDMSHKSDQFRYRVAFNDPFTHGRNEICLRAIYLSLFTRLQ